MFHYNVRCRFEGAAADVVEQWLAWMRNEHLADVITAGAASAELVAIDLEVPTYEARYTFASRADFEQYERDHAPRLRAEGLRRFPLERGLRYERTIGGTQDDRLQR